MEQVKFECFYEGCGKNYSNAFNLKRHVESFHRGIKKFTCSICNKGLSSKQNLREHSFIHLGIKPYVCKHVGCKEAYRQASQLLMHQIIHDEVDKQINRRYCKNYLNNSFFTALLTQQAIDSTIVNGFYDIILNENDLSENKIQNLMTNSD